MPKKKIVKRTSKVVTKVSNERKSNYSWIWWTLGIIVLLAVLFFVYKGMTGNVITGNGIKESIQSGWTTNIQPILEYLLGWDASGATSNTYKFDDFFTMALLFLIIVFSVVYLSLKQVSIFNDPDHGWVLWVLSIVVSLLAVRFLTADWLVTILLPYSTLGVAISAGIPFVLYFFVVSKFTAKSSRKVAWIFFAVIFLYLYYDRTSTANAVALETGPYYAIYLWTAILSFIMILFDGTFQKFRREMQHEKANAMNKGPALQSLEGMLNQIHQDFASQGTAYTQKYPVNVNVSGIAAYNNDVKEIERRIKTLLK
jgi:hypothetical protein